MNDSIFLPKRIKVGFQNRQDIYTKKLAYVIYYDEKGKLRKQNSWEHWRDKTIEPQEFDNIPTEGFVLNKHVGGHKAEWNFRQAYVRVYDPRGFEFEITIPNLLYILENTNSIKGKGLEGEFVYGWSGTDLVLLPTSSPDYIKLQEVNNKRFDKKYITSKDLKPGFKYLTRSNKEYVYMGYFDAYEDVYKFDGKQFLTTGPLEKYARENNKPLQLNVSGHRQFYAYSGGTPTYIWEPGCVGKRYFFATDEDFYGFKRLKSISGKFIEEISDSPIQEYPELMEKLERTTIYSPIDSTRNIVGKCTDEEIQKRIGNHPWGRRFLTKLKDAVEEYIIYIDYNASNPTNVHCQFSSNDSNSRMADYFGWDRTDRTGISTINLTLEEIFKVLPPCYVDQYLANGKYYRRIYSYG